MTGWEPIITGVLTIIGLLLKAWMDKAPQRAKENQDDATQGGRANLAAGNVGAVNDRIDVLLSDEPTSGLAGEHDSGDLLGRVREETGADILPDRTGSTGTVTGESGSL